VRIALASLVAVFVLTGFSAAAPRPFEVTKLPEPRWSRTGPVPRGDANVKLVLVSSVGNAITDVGNWFRRHGLRLREHRLRGGLEPDFPLYALPAGTPVSFRGARLVRSVRQSGTQLGFYGRNFAEARYVLARRGGRALYGFDFANYAHLPKALSGPGGSVYQSTTWAVEARGALYVSHSHAGFARDSSGLNGFVTAIDLRTRKVLWRSRSLVANAYTFEVVGNVIVTGYGFAEEPDYLYLLDRRTGGVLQRLRVPTAPEYLIRRGRTLFVRTYDRDLVVRLSESA